METSINIVLSQGPCNLQPLKHLETLMIQTSPWNPMESPGHDLQCRNADIDPGGLFSAYHVVGLPSGAGAVRGAGMTHGTVRGETP